MWELRWEDLQDRSVISLLISNLIVILWALYEEWDAYIVMWVYWGQSVIIGIFWFLRVIAYKNLYNRNFLNPDGTPKRLHPLLRFGAGLLFLFVYGMFHFGYAETLLSRDFLWLQSEALPIKHLIIFACIFFINQVLSFLWTSNENRDKWVSFQRFMALPYLRIFPMHFTFFIGGLLQLHKVGGEPVLLLFLILKTVADMNGYVKLKKGFVDEDVIRALSQPRPKIRKTAQGEELVLPDGQVISLDDNLELAKKVETIQKFPADVQFDVYKKILSEETQPIQEEHKLKCRCNEMDVIEGQEAEKYAEQHLTFIRTIGDGTKFEYVCPETGKRWVKVGNLLKAE